MVPIRNTLTNKDTYRLKVKEQKKIFYVNGNQKQAGVAILISEIISFRVKTAKRQKEKHND